MKDAYKQVCIYCWLFGSVAYEKSDLKLQYWGAQYWVRDSMTRASEHDKHNDLQNKVAHPVSMFKELKPDLVPLQKDREVKDY